jgi:succinylglutamic semialdehyde dehydrogenase
VVFKPSELTPATAELTVKLWLQAGIPDGVINLIQGERDRPGVAGKPGYRRRAVYRQRFYRVPFPSLPQRPAGENAGAGDGRQQRADRRRRDRQRCGAECDYSIRLYLAGQRCTCARRLLVKRGAEGDALLQRLVEASARIRSGKWDAEPQPFMGGVISLQAAQGMLAAQDKLEELGGNVLLRLHQPDPRSTLLTPGIIDVTGLDVPDEEYFGPLLTVIRYDTFDEAIRIANHTRYGLAAGLISADPALFEQFADEARAGIVNWNKPLTGASSKAPFGGVGASGNHRASAWYAADYCAWPMASWSAKR